MSTPSKKRYAARAKIFGYKIGVECPRCSHGFTHNIGAIDPAEVKCLHNWKYDPYRGPRGVIVCTNANCGMCIDMKSFEYIMEACRLAAAGELVVKAE